MPHGLAALQRLGIDTSDLGRPFLGIAYHAGGHTAVGHFPRGLTGLGVRRMGLDERLRHAARSHPRITLVEGTRVTQLHRDREGVTLRTSRGDVRTHLVVGADGLHSTVRRLSGLALPDRRAKRYGARLHVQLASGRSEPDHVHVYAGSGSELYVTPVGPGQVNLALLCEPQVAKQLKGDAEGGLRRALGAFDAGRQLLDGAEPLSEAAVCGPLRQRVRRVVDDRVLLVGDAAGFVDAVTGEGMSLSLLSAEAAAQAAVAALQPGGVDARKLEAYGVRRARLARDLCTLTEVVVAGLRRPALAGRVVGALAAEPAAFERFLAVQVGQAPITSLGGPLATVARRLIWSALSPNGQLAVR